MTEKLAKKQNKIDNFIMLLEKIHAFEKLTSLIRSVLDMTIFIHL